MSLISTIIALIKATETVSGDIDIVATQTNDRTPVSLASGTGASQADVVFSDTRTLAASATETLDLNALTDSAGRTRNFAKIKAILIHASSANTNNVIVGNAASTQFQGGFDAATDTWAIPPNGDFLVTAPVAGWSSANAAADKLKIANSGAGTGVDYDIVLVGTSV